MRGEGGIGRGRVPRAAALLAALVSVAATASALEVHGASGAALITSLAPRGPNETRTTIPVSDERGAEPRVVLSEPLRAGGGLERGDVIRAVAEVQLTTTCVEPVQRCIGHPYGYSPRLDAQVVLAAGPSATGGAGADPISGVESKTCNQHRPDRNHHCVLTFGDAVKRVRNLSALPCAPSGCFVNVVASASHAGAHSGDVVIVGADRPDGSIDQDKARVDALVARGDVPGPAVTEGGTKMSGYVPIKPDGDAGRRVVRSLRLDGLRKGDVLRINARQAMSLGNLPYNAFVGTRMIVAENARAERPGGFVNRSISLGGSVTEQNGFNCTYGPSAYRTPCTAEKAAIVAVRGKLPQHHHQPKPVFVNIVVAGAPKLHPAHSGDRMVTGDGRIKVERYRVPG